MLFIYHIFRRPFLHINALLLWFTENGTYTGIKSSKCSNTTSSYAIHHSHKQYSTDSVSTYTKQISNANYFFFSFFSLLPFYIPPVESLSFGFLQILLIYFYTYEVNLRPRRVWCWHFLWLRNGQWIENPC